MDRFSYLCKSKQTKITPTIFKKSSQNLKKPYQDFKS